MNNVNICFCVYAQWEGGEDRCNNNWVHGNTIETCGNECVEIKEGSSGNLVEDNVCSNQFDAKSGCYGARGDDNTIRYTRVYLTSAKMF